MASSEGISPERLSGLIDRQFDELLPVCKYCRRQADDDIPPGWTLVFNDPWHWECWDCSIGQRSAFYPSSEK